MDDLRLEDEYLSLIDALNAVEAERQRIVAGYRPQDGPLSVDDPIFDEWEAADDRVKAAREALRSFIAANQGVWRPSALSD